MPLTAFAEIHVQFLGHLEELRGRQVDLPPEGPLGIVEEAPFQRLVPFHRRVVIGQQAAELGHVARAVLEGLAVEGGDFLLVRGPVPGEHPGRASDPREVEVAAGREIPEPSAETILERPDGLGRGDAPEEEARLLLVRQVAHVGGVVEGAAEFRQRRRPRRGRRGLVGGHRREPFAPSRQGAVAGLARRGETGLLPPGIAELRGQPGHQPQPRAPVGLRARPPPVDQGGQFELAHGQPRLRIQGGAVRGAGRRPAEPQLPAARILLEGGPERRRGPTGRPPLQRGGGDAEGPGGLDGEGDRIAAELEREFERPGVHLRDLRLGRLRKFRLGVLACRPVRRREELGQRAALRDELEGLGPVVRVEPAQLRLGVRPMEVRIARLAAGDPEQRVDRQLGHVGLQAPLLGRAPEEGVAGQRVDGFLRVLRQRPFAVEDEGERDLQAEVFAAQRQRVGVPGERPDLERRRHLILRFHLREERLHPLGAPEELLEETREALAFGEAAQRLRSGPCREALRRAGAGDQQGLPGADGEERVAPKFLVGFALGVGLGRDQGRSQARLQFREVLLPATVEQPGPRVREQRGELRRVSSGRRAEIVRRGIERRLGDLVGFRGFRLAGAGPAIDPADPGHRFGLLTARLEEVGEEAGVFGRRRCARPGRGSRCGGDRRGGGRVRRDRSKLLLRAQGEDAGGHGEDAQPRRAYPDEAAAGRGGCLGSRHGRGPTMTRPDPMTKA